MIPIVGVTSEEQMRDNLGCLDVELDAEQVARLDEVSAIDLGFPYEFLRSDYIKRLVYGDAYELVDDRRLGYRRSRADEVAAAASAMRQRCVGGRRGRRCRRRRRRGRGTRGSSGASRLRRSGDAQRE